MEGGGDSGQPLSVSFPTLAFDTDFLLELPAGTPAIVPHASQFVRPAVFASQHLRSPRAQLNELGAMLRQSSHQHLGPDVTGASGTNPVILAKYTFCADSYGLWL